MAKQKVVKRWITVNGNRVPIYEDGTMGGIGAKLQGNSKTGKKVRVRAEALNTDGTPSFVRREEFDSEEEAREWYEEMASKGTFENYDFTDEDGNDIDIKNKKKEKEDFVVDYPIKDDPDYDKKRIAREIADEEDFDERLDSIADRYNTSKPVSGSWDTEVEHEQNAIAEAFNISKEEAKQKMIDELGFEEDQFKSDGEKKNPLYGKGISELRGDEEARRLIDSIEEAEEEMRGRGIDKNDDDFWANARKSDIQKLKDEYGYEWDKDEELPFQSKGMSKEEKAEDWAKGTEKDIASKKANIKEMGYAEAGQFISDHKEEFGLSDDDDAYQIAAQIKNGDIKLDKNGKVSKADRDKVSEGLKAMDKAAKERGDYIEDEDEPANGSKKGSAESQKVKVGGREVDVSKEAPAELKSIKGGKMSKEEAMMNYKAIRISKYMPKEKQAELRKLKAQYYKIWKG